jgi:predicted dehydrogenase
MTIKIAFAGTGYISRVHTEAARKLPQVELAAVVNHHPDSLHAFAQRFGIRRTYLRVEDMLADGGVDALVVSTPNYLHALQTIAALQVGVHVMVEKPMAMNAAEAQAMLSASQASGALLMVAHCWRFDDEVQWLKKQVESGRLGRIIRTKSYGVHVNWGPSGWFTQKVYAGGGAMADMGIHAIDTVRYLLGDPQPRRVVARIGTHYLSADVDDTGVLMVEWANGATSYIEAGWWQPHSDGAEAAGQLYGTLGFGSVFPTLLELRDAGGQGGNTVDPGFAYPRAEHFQDAMYERQMAYFITCIQQGITPKPGGLEGWVNMLIVDAAYRSARSGQVEEIETTN